MLFEVKATGLDLAQRGGAPASFGATGANGEGDFVFGGTVPGGVFTVGVTAYYLTMLN
jgi:hypothetical protein